MSDNIDYTEIDKEEIEDMMEADMAKAVNQGDKETQNNDENEAQDADKDSESKEESGLEEMEDEMEAMEETAGTEGKEKASKSFFKKKDKKDKKDEKIEELNDRLIRTMAEFDNFRKRTEKEKTQMFEIGAKDIIEKVLPVIDNFERGLKALSEEEKESAFAKGIEQIYKQFITTLETAGVKQIESVGNEFDPNFHNAVMHAEDEALGDNIVAEEFQKGYLYRDTVVRHSMVKVVN